MNSSVPPTPSHLGSRIHSSSSRRSPRTLNYPGSTLFCSSTSRSRISPSCPSRPVCGNGSPKLFVTDGLQGMPEAIAEWFTESKRQLCLVHVQRNISQATRRSRRSLQSGRNRIRSWFRRFWERPIPCFASTNSRRRCGNRFTRPTRRNRQRKFDVGSSLPGTRIQYNSEDSALIVLAKVYEDYNRNAMPARFMLEMSEEEKKETGFSA